MNSSRAQGLLASPRRAMNRRLSLLAHQHSGDNDNDDDNDAMDGDRKVEHTTTAMFTSPVRRRRASLGVSVSPNNKSGGGGKSSPKDEKALLRQKKKKKGFNMKPLNGTTSDAVDDGATKEAITTTVKQTTVVVKQPSGSSNNQNAAKASPGGWGGRLGGGGGSRRASMGSVPLGRNDMDSDESYDIMDLPMNNSFVSATSQEFDVTSEVDPMVVQKNNEDMMASFDDIAQRGSFDDIAQRKPKAFLRPSAHDTPIQPREMNEDEDEDDPQPQPSRTPLRQKSSTDYDRPNLAVRNPPALPLLQSPRRATSRRFITNSCEGVRAPMRTSSYGSTNAPLVRAPTRTSSQRSGAGGTFRAPIRTISNGSIKTPSSDDESKQQEKEIPPQTPRRTTSRRFSSDGDPQTPAQKKVTAPRRYSSDDGTLFQHYSPRRTNPRRFASEKSGGRHQFHSPRRTQPRRLSSLGASSPSDLQTPRHTNAKKVGRNLCMTPIRRISIDHNKPTSASHHEPPSSHSQSVSSSSSTSKEMAAQRPPRSSRRPTRKIHSDERAVRVELQRSFNESLNSLGSGSSNDSFSNDSNADDAVVGPPTPELSKEEWDTLSIDQDDRQRLVLPASPVKKTRSKLKSDDETVFSDPEFETETSSESQHPKLYSSAMRCLWSLVAMECSISPRDAKYVEPENGTTALHLAVMSRADPRMRNSESSNFQPAPLSVIKLLLLACPEAAIIRCGKKRYTPLCYACLVTNGYDMEDSAEMVDILLNHAPHSALVFSDDGFSALDVHIISYSRLHQQRHEVSNNGRSSTLVMRTLLEAEPSLVQPRLYGTRMRGPVELLYRCNISAFKEASCQDVLERGSGCTITSTLCDWWAWKWVVVLLKVTWIPSDLGAEEYAPFSAVHAAARVVACPGPIMQLALDAFPEQAEYRSPASEKYNCPLHEVCGWVTDEWTIDGDPFILKRKRIAIALLVGAFPKATRMTNNLGETPLQLAVETCTPWDHGLAGLVKAFGRALLLPRNLDKCPDDGPLATAMSFHADDLGSFCDEDEWEDEPLAAVSGFYPFMVAAVLACVPERKSRAAPLHFADQVSRDQSKNVANKDLESLRSIYGLLRARPQALALYIEDEKRRRKDDEVSVCISDDDDDDKASTSYTSGGESTNAEEDSDILDSSEEESLEEITSDESSST